MKQPKFRNKKTVIDGITFDSKKEATRYGQLKLLQQCGQIDNLKMQVPFVIEIGGKKICTYKADFTYIEKSRYVVEDVKGMKTPVYNLKKKLMKAIHGIDIKEI